MMEKYQNKYRIPSARAHWWDYGWNGAYFITICTANRSPYFGDIQDGKMVLSAAGAIADVLWHEIPHHAHHVELGDFVVMPNHVHGILILDRPDFTPVRTFPPRQEETLHATSLQQGHMSRISPKADSLSVILRAYKSAVTKHANRLGLDFGWQTRFHDHIIRNDVEYQRISDYIVSNPTRWEACCRDVACNVSCHTGLPLGAKDVRDRRRRYM